MITAKELLPIGYVSKTHGIKGELNVRLDADYTTDDVKFVVMDVDSIFVPFVIESSRGNAADNRLVKLEGVDSQEEAKAFVGKTLYAVLADLATLPGFDQSQAADSENLYLSDLVGYTLTDGNNNVVGSITGFNDDTQNYLLEVTLNEGRTVFVPFVDEWMLDLDQDKKTLSFDLPEGLLD